MTSKPSYSVGDVLVWQHKGGDHVRREIVAVRPTGYSWRYPGLGSPTGSGGENLFFSEDSSDPFFEIGWTREGLA